MLKRDSDEHDELDDIEQMDEELEDADLLDRAGGAGGFLSGLLVGGLIGAGVAILLAPERGAVTRRQLKRRFEHMRDDTRDQLGEWSDDARREFRRTKRKLRRRVPQR